MSSIKCGGRAQGGGIGSNPHWETARLQEGPGPHPVYVSTLNRGHVTLPRMRKLVSFGGNVIPNPYWKTNTIYDRGRQRKTSSQYKSSYKMCRGDIEKYKIHIFRVFHGKKTVFFCIQTRAPFLKWEADKIWRHNATMHGMA